MLHCTRLSGYCPLLLTPKGLVEKNDKRFTKLPADLLTKKLPLIGEYGFRLMYYYESYINRSSPNAVDYAFPAFETITRETGISPATIENYNRILWENHLIDITRHKISGFYTVNQQGDESYLGYRYNNHYKVMIENISKDFKYLRRKEPPQKES